MAQSDNRCRIKVESGLESLPRQVWKSDAVLLVFVAMVSCRMDPNLGAECCSCGGSPSTRQHQVVVGEGR